MFSGYGLTAEVRSRDRTWPVRKGLTAETRRRINRREPQSDSQGGAEKVEPQGGAE